jgi:hypothetical protein
MINLFHGSSIHYLGEMILFKRLDSSGDRAAVRYSEGTRFEFRSGCTFSYPVIFGAQRGTVTEYSSEFNLYFSVFLWNSRMNFNIEGENDTVQNCSLFSSRVAKSTEPRCGIPRVAGSISSQAAHFSHPVTHGKKCLPSPSFYHFVLSRLKGLFTKYRY